MKKIIISIFALSILIAVFAGCGKKNEGTLIVGVMDDYPPMGYRNTAGELVGFEVDLARAVAGEMGADIEFYIVDRQGMISTLKEKEVDILVSSVSYTEEKAKYAYIDFSIPYLENGHVIVTTPDLSDSISSIDSLNGLIVGVEAESTVDKMATAQKESVGFTLISYESIAVCVAALRAGQLDCVICDMPVAIDIVEKNPDKYVISSAYITDEPLAIALSIGNEKLQNQLNEAIKVLKDNGKLSELSIKYLGEDYTKDLED